MLGFGKKEKIAVIFDIGSSSVGGAYVSFLPGMKPKIFAGAREEMVFQEDLKFDRLVSSMQDALGRCGKALHAHKLPLWTEKMFFCSFSSPWYASQTRIASTKSEHPFVVTDNLLTDSVEKEVQDFQAIEAERLGEGTLMEHEAIQVKLNGYETSNPIGKTATTADVAVYVSIVPEQIFSLVKEQIGRMYHPSRVRFHSFPFIAFAAIRDFFHKESFLFLDISGEVTDVSLVRGGILQETASFPCGKNCLLRGIVRELSVSESKASPAEALSALTLYTEGAHHDQGSEKMAKVLERAGEEWLSGFRSALDAFMKGTPSLPSDIFFTADSDVSGWFANRIQDEKNVLFAGGSGSFEVRPLEARFFTDWIECENGIIRDSFLSLETLYVMRNFTS